MRELTEAYREWRATPFPSECSSDALDELRADLALVDLWLAELVIPFVEQGILTRVAVDVDGKLCELQERLAAVSPDDAAALADDVSGYRRYLALLVNVKQTYDEGRERLA